MTERYISLSQVENLFSFVSTTSGLDTVYVGIPPPPPPTYSSGSPIGKYDNNNAFKERGTVFDLIRKRLPRLAQARRMVGHCFYQCTPDLSGHVRDTQVFFFFANAYKQASIEQYRDQPKRIFPK